MYWVAGGFELPVPVSEDTSKAVLTLSDEGTALYYVRTYMTYQHFNCHSLSGTMSGEFLKVPPGFKVGIDFGQEGALSVDILKAGVEGV